MYKDDAGNVYPGMPRTDVNPETGRPWIVIPDQPDITPMLPPGYSVITSPEPGNGSPYTQGYQWLRGPDGQIYMPNSGDPNNNPRAQFINGTSYEPYDDVLKAAAASNKGWYNDALPAATLGALAGGVGYLSGGFGLGDMLNSLSGTPSTGGGAPGFGGGAGVDPWQLEPGFEVSAPNAGVDVLPGYQPGASAAGSGFSLPGGFSPANLAGPVLQALRGMGGGGAGAGGAGGATGGGAGGNFMSSLPGILTGAYDLFAGGQKVDPTKLNTLWQAGLDTYNLSRDPQQALYNATLQKMQDQVRAGQSARGVAMSPFGAGGEADAASRFNIDWTNSQLGRQLSGLQGLTEATGGYFRQANQDQTRRDNAITSGTNALLTGFNNATAPGGWLNAMNPGATTGGAGNTQNPWGSYYSGTPMPYYGDAGTSFANPGNFYGGTIDPAMMQSYNYNAAQGLPY